MSWKWTGKKRGQTERGEKPLRVNVVLYLRSLKTLAFSAWITLSRSQVQPIRTFLCGAGVTPPHPWEDGIILYLEG